MLVESRGPRSQLCHDGRNVYYFLSCNMIEKNVHQIKHVLISNLFLKTTFSLVLLFQNILVLLLRAFTFSVFLMQLCIPVAKHVRLRAHHLHMVTKHAHEHFLWCLSTNVSFGSCGFSGFFSWGLKLRSNASGSRSAEKLRSGLNYYCSRTIARLHLFNRMNAQNTREPALDPLVVMAVIRT